MASVLLWASAHLKRLALGERIRRHPLHYPRAVRHFTELAGLGVEERRARVQARLAEVLRAAGRTAHGRAAGAPRELTAWPYIDKGVVRAATPSFRAAAGWVASHANTSGTTGVPLQLIRSSESLAYEQAAIDGVFERLGVCAREARVAVLRGEKVDTGSDRWWQLSQHGRRLTLSSYDLDRRTIPAYAETLRRFRPDVLCAYPSALESLCRLLADAGQAVRVPSVICSSEILCPSTWQLAREVLGCEMADYYGQAERVAFASALAPHEYRFLPGYAHVELMRTGGDELEATYEIVGTPLWNLAMPLVRYRTGDLVRLPATLSERELEEIALGARTFKGIVGRSADVLLLSEGTRLTAINHIPRDVTRIVALQIVQDSLDHVRIRVLPGPRYDAAEGEAFLARARTVLPVTMRVTIEPTDALERGVLGKIPVVVHSPAVRDALRARTAGQAEGSRS
jgi:phenylacetate-CoA ligase